MARTKKIAVYLSVTVDVDALTEAYGIDDSDEAIREDVRYSVLNAISSGAIYGDERVVVDARLTN